MLSRGLRLQSRYARLGDRTRAFWHARTPALAERLIGSGTRVANAPFQRDRIPLPPPIVIDCHEIDIISDLVDYTQLPRSIVEDEVGSRRRTSFRVEWHGTPGDLRADHWFYLSAKGYLFANAVHFADRAFLDHHLLPHIPPGGVVLDFGAGSGNLALQLAASGFEVTMQELSALQRDFIRHRVRSSPLRDRLTVLDWWQPLPVRAFDAVVAVDVLEHLPNARQLLDESLLPCLRPGGLLIENSPFVVNVANPMHHDDYGFEEHMAESGVTLVHRDSTGTNVWQADGAGSTG